jgi:hypothetical protein
MLLISFIDVPQYAFICLIKCVGNFIEDAPHTWWKTMPQRFQLAVDPPKPASQDEHVSPT